jgi:hypothetical protein
LIQSATVTPVPVSSSSSAALQPAIGKRRDAATDGHAVGGHAAEGCCDTPAKPRSHDTSRIAWAKLRGEEFPLECPNCGGDIRLITFITEPGPILKILTLQGHSVHPRLPHHPPDSTTTTYFRPRIHTRPICRQASSGGPLA